MTPKVAVASHLATMGSWTHAIRARSIPIAVLVPSRTFLNMRRTLILIKKLSWHLTMVVRAILSRKIMILGFNPMACVEALIKLVLVVCRGRGRGRGRGTGRGKCKGQRKRQRQPWLSKHVLESHDGTYWTRRRYSACRTADRKQTKFYTIRIR